MALSVAPASSTSPGKLMMIGWATPTVEPLTGTNFGGPNGAVPVNGVGSCPPAGPPPAGQGQAATQWRAARQPLDRQEPDPDPDPPTRDPHSAPAPSPISKPLLL